MKITLVRGMLVAGALCAFALGARAQTIELRATINAAQEAPATTSPATGSAVMLYDVGTNTFDLVVSITGMTNTATLSHIHEGAVGVAGGVVTNLGGEAVYTRNGSTLTATFRGVRHGGDRLKLIQGGAYYNIHSAQFPGGEVRGQLIARPKRLYAVMDVAQEQAAFPAVNLTGANLNDFGAAVMTYDPTTNAMKLRISLYNFNNTLNNSHFHAEIPGKSGAVVVNLGNTVNTTLANGGSYTTANGNISGTFDIPMTGVDPITMLLGVTYLNFHSTTFTGGELRGQVWPSEETPGSRIANLAVRGFVGTGDQVLIQGITVNGPEPVRVLITGKGPSLTVAGVTGALANPRLQLFDSGRRQIATNDDVGALVAGSELAAIPGVPTNPLESALVVVLPPGNYTAVLSGVTGTGVGLLEVTDLRNLLGGSSVSAASSPDFITLQRQAVPARAASGATVAPEICVTPIAGLVATR